MAKFENAYIKEQDKLIKTHDYKDDLHYGKIFCPECYEAPLHIVIKQKIPPYFASNSKLKHSEDCQYYADHIESVLLKKLIDEDKDKERVDFLIQNNLNKTLKLFLKIENKIIKNKLESENLDNSQTKSIICNNYKYESIPRLSINNLFKKKKFHINKYLIVWGRADIEIRSIEREFCAKKIIFRIDNKYYFSTNLTEKMVKYFSYNFEKKNVQFAVFGELNEKNNFIELKIKTTKHIKFL